MKKIILLLLAIGFISMGAAKMSFTNDRIEKRVGNKLIIQKYKACIDACNECVRDCKKCEAACVKEKDPKLDRCIKLCKETIASCTAASELMSLNSEYVKEMCGLCAKLCDNCAAECEKFTTMEHCKVCATSCRKASKLCKEM